MRRPQLAEHSGPGCTLGPVEGPPLPRNSLTESGVSETTPVQLFELLVRLLQAAVMPQAAVLKQLKPLATATREVPAKLGRTYLITKGSFYQLTAVFEQPSWNLYQITLRLDPAAYA